jgi:hypothetical protein
VDKLDYSFASLLLISGHAQRNPTRNHPTRPGAGQGDPLSPLLFILAADPLHRLLHVATERGCLSKLTGKVARFRASMYADDTFIFLKPSHGDVTNLKCLLLNFGARTGLRTNLQKTSVTAVRCGNLDLDSILADFPVARAHFPLKYLGLPLTPMRLSRIDFQPLVNKALRKLSNWNGRNLTQAGRVRLTKPVLTS